MSVKEESVITDIIEQIIGNEAVVKKLALYALLTHEYATNDETAHITEIYMPANNDLGKIDDYKIRLIVGVEQSLSDPAGYVPEFCLYAVNGHTTTTLLSLTKDMEFEYSKVVLGGIISKELVPNNNTHLAVEASKALYLSMVSVMDVVNKDFAELINNDDPAPVEYINAIL